MAGQVTYMRAIASGLKPTAGFFVKGAFRVSRVSRASRASGFQGSGFPGFRA